MKKIYIIGAGSWGTALALTALRAGKQKVTLITRQAKEASILSETRINQTYLPNIPLPSALTVTHDLETLRDADIVLQVTPAQTIREICLDVQKHLPPTAPWVICSKGILLGRDKDEPQLLSKVSQDLLPNPVAVLSGPSFADEVGLNLPTAVTVACENEKIAKLIAGAFRHPHFRCYISDDPIGVQVAGAIKNILAIACGIVRGKGFGNNAAAALITRGLAEMRRLGLALGGKSDTFLGLSAVGDVTLTCSSEQSRNMRLGLALGQKGANVEKILKDCSFIAEGVPTTAAVYKLSRALSIPMPLCQALYNLLYDHIPLDKVVDHILSHQSELEF
jgi:glycerol-3-phosphate dehydrogenase (NAD(P)+)